METFHRRGGLSRLALMGAGVWDGWGVLLCRVMRLMRELFGTLVPLVPLEPLVRSFAEAAKLGGWFRVIGSPPRGKRLCYLFNGEDAHKIAKKWRGSQRGREV